MSTVRVNLRVAEGAILIIGVLLRLYLAVVNGEANDDHLTVIRIIADEHRLPRLRDAWEGFQPKLYHATVAMLWNLSPWQSSAVQIRIAQGVSCIAGIATLAVLRAGLAPHRLSATSRLLALALVSLNPTLIGLNAQATNDSFVILLGTLALTAGAAFFRSGGRRPFAVMSAATVLATLSKGNGLVVFAAIATTFAQAIVRTRAIAGLARSHALRLGAGFVALFLVTTTVFGSYRPNWQDTGNPFAINGEPAALPYWFEPTYVYRPGTTSIAQTYFTFRFIGLMREPAISNGIAPHPLHRTSLWSQLYGRSHVAHFSQHPPSWKNTSALVFTVARAILVLALLPTALLICGLGRGVMSLVTDPGSSAEEPGERLVDQLLVLTAFGFVAFIVLYTLTYRDFATMKAEFLFPAIYPGAVLLARELDHTRNRLENRRWLRAAIPAALVALLVLYLAEAVILAAQLT
jgi:hypothetical protein